MDLFALQGSKNLNFKVFALKVLWDAWDWVLQHFHWFWDASSDFLGTHRQTLTWSCAAVRKGTMPDRAWTSLCGNRCRWCCRSDTLAGKNLYRRPTECQASSSSTHECSFDTLPEKAKINREGVEINKQLRLSPKKKRAKDSRKSLWTEFHYNFICSVKYESLRRQIGDDF